MKRILTNVLESPLLVNTRGSVSTLLGHTSVGVHRDTLGLGAR